ncbi:unnamed protein product [Diamesa hyperborea]
MKYSLVYLVLIFVTLLVAPSMSEHQKPVKESAIAYFKGSLPNQIFRCVQKFNLLRCLKYLVLLRMESRDYSITESSNFTADFIENILHSETNLPSEIPDHLLKLDETELNDRLTDGFQKFFKNRAITLHFIPNMLVKVVPSKSNSLEFSLKKYKKNGRYESGRAAVTIESEERDENSKDIDEGEEEIKDGDLKDDKGLRRKGYGHYLQMGIPLLLAPGLVFAGILPMLLPVLKMATIFTSVINHSALIAGIMYLARQHAVEKEMQQTMYFNPGYKERNYV